MIDRYTRPEMGRIWSEPNKFRQWLEVELATAEALAEVGQVPQDRPAACASTPVSTSAASRRSSARSGTMSSRLPPLYRKACRGRPRRSFALAAFRPDLERRRRHRPGLAGSRGVGNHRPGPERSGGRFEKARLRIQGHGSDRPDPRGPCRADHVRPQAGSVVRRNSAELGVSPRPNRCASARFRAP